MKKLVLMPYDRYQRLLVKDDPPKIQEPLEDEPAQSTKCEQLLEPKDNPPETTVKSEKDNEALLQHFPKTMQNRVRSVLRYIAPHITWNSRDEVTLEGREIPNSNIVDLIKVHIKDYKDFQPVGKEAFGQLLAKLNVPASLLASSARQQLGQGSVPPPPGIPVKRPFERSGPKKVKWRRL